MTRCPHCGKIANPLRFLTYTRWSPYRCAHCGKKSRFNSISIGLISGLCAGVGLWLLRSVTSARGIELFGEFVIMTILVLTLAMWFVLPLHADAPEALEPAETTRTGGARR